MEKIMLIADMMMEKCNDYRRVHRITSMYLEKRGKDITRDERNNLRNELNLINKKLRTAHWLLNNLLNLWDIPWEAVV